MQFKTAIKLITSHNNALMVVFPEYGPKKKLSVPVRRSLTKGYMISFEAIKGPFLCSGHFPDKRNGEKLITDPEQAWEYAQAFAKATVGLTCNIYIINEKFCPVDEYYNKKIVNR